MYFTKVDSPKLLLCPTWARTQDLTTKGENATFCPIFREQVNAYLGNKLTHVFKNHSAQQQPGLNKRLIEIRAPKYNAIVRILQRLKHTLEQTTRNSIYYLQFYQPQT